MHVKTIYKNMVRFQISIKSKKAGKSTLPTVMVLSKRKLDDFVDEKEQDEVLVSETSSSTSSSKQQPKERVTISSSSSRSKDLDGDVKMEKEESEGAPV